MPNGVCRLMLIEDEIPEIKEKAMRRDSVTKVNFHLTCLSLLVEKLKRDSVFKLNNVVAN